MKKIKQIGTYIVIPLLVIGLAFYLINTKVCDLEKSATIVNNLVQSVAILIGGLWAYRRFDWDKKAENALKIKAMLMDYTQNHSLAAGQYRIDQINKIDDMQSWTNFAMRMIPTRNEFARQVHLSIYLPEKTRKRLFDTVWLSLNKGKGPRNENINDNWKKFGEELDKINKELDDIVNS
jgi:hypothetical protein